MTIFFTSDHHFGHDRIIEYTGRPFSSVRDMNEAMIARWNIVVREVDTVYHLGDVTFYDEEFATHIISRLNGEIFFIEGNHDRKWFGKPVLRNVQYLPPIYELNVHGQLVILSHYPMRVWNRSHHRSWHLFGHTHGTLEPHGLSFDCGVDTNNFYPYSFQHVKDKMDMLIPTQDYLEEQ